MKTVMCSPLNALISHFEKYFSEDVEKHNWIKNLFVDNANASQGFTSLEAEQFIDLSSDLILKSLCNLKYPPKNLDLYCSKIEKTYL